MLNNEQMEIVNSKEHKILVLAGAGTGKTHCMLERIKKLIHDGVDPTTILVLTFTNAAACNMDIRFKSDNKSKFKKLSPEFKTFHAFCYGLLANDKDVRSQFGYTSIPSILSEIDYSAFKKTVKTKYSVKLSDSKLSGNQVLSKSDQFQFDLFRKCLKQELIQSNKITFDMLCYDICELFVNNHPCIEKYHNQYNYIFVDEFQDTDEKQWRFVKSFKNADLYVVGDFLQNLYRFRGTDPTIIKSLANSDDWTIYKLHRNYRSTKQICDFANENSLYADSSCRIEIDSDKSGDNVHVIHMSDGALDKIYSELIPRCKSLNKDETLAVLCRTNAEVAEIKGELKSNGISISDSESDLSFKKKLLSTCMDDSAFLNMLAADLTNESYAEYIRIKSLYESSDFEIDKFLSFFQNKGMSKAIILMNQIHEIIWNELYDYRMKYDKLIELLNLPYIKVNFDEIVSDESLINSVISIIESIKSDSNIYVGTIHSAKGLEYDEVHLVNVGGKTFRLTSEDNNNVYYVGITRAKTDLYVYLCR